MHRTTHGSVLGWAWIAALIGAPAACLFPARQTAQAEGPCAPMETGRIVVEGASRPAATTGDDATAGTDRASTPVTAPDWLGMAPRQVGNVYQVTVKTDPRATRQECERELPTLTDAAIKEYARTKLGQPARIVGEVELPWSDARKLIKEQWAELVATSFGQWTELHVLLEFDPRAKGLIEQECNRAIVAGRLWYVGTGLAAVLALLSVLYAALKIDLTTGGRYRTRLTWAAVGIALVVATTAYGMMTLLKT